MNIEQRILRLERKILKEGRLNHQNNIVVPGKYYATKTTPEIAENVYQYFVKKIQRKNIKYAEYLGEMRFYSSPSGIKFRVCSGNIFNWGNGSNRTFGEIWIDKDGNAIKDNLDMASIAWSVKNLFNSSKKENYEVEVLNRDFI